MPLIRIGGFIAHDGYQLVTFCATAIELKACGTPMRAHWHTLAGSAQSSRLECSCAVERLEREKGIGTQTLEPGKVYHE